ncbi:MAG: DUF2493 domain-containing protein [Candidatus Micrarchaeota archaeon]|nr:DUF2493 domain-containing protein [Candidatus Micrarchaeota archaeon]
MQQTTAKCILVCGGRDYSDVNRVYRVLDEFYDQYQAIGISLRIVAGGATGADTIAENWARDRGVPCKVYPANWALHKKAAGPIRNAQMLKEGKPDLVLAFAGGVGTADMIAKAKKAKVHVMEILEDVVG